ncbi:MAG: hypothetical protein L0Z62_26325 [Gemmataceae bacterium]|nr:hypothetical protein [Gemmataceae bacterium]
MSDSSLTGGEEPERGRGHAAQWGLASVLTGGLVLLLAPLILINNILAAAFGPRRMGMSPAEITLVTWGLGISLVLVLLLGLTALLFALVGVVSARVSRQPVALALAGLLVSLVALFLFLVAATDSVFVLVWFNREPFR